MAVATPYRTFADVLKRLGGIPAERVRFDIKPGRATVRDLTTIHAREDRLYELVDGFLVEKPMGAKESFLAAELIWYFRSYLETNDLGFVLAPDGTLRILPRLVRLADVAFISWDQRPDRTVPDEQVPSLYPDIAVEVLSPKNTRAEIKRKLKEFFTAGTKLVWVVHPKKREVTVYTAPDQSATLTEADRLDGGAVLPGFTLELKKLFGKLEK